MDVIYKLEGVDLRDYGVFVSGSEGLLSRPNPKKPVTVNWDDYHGEVVDLSKRTYEAREIKLECFIKADSQWDFQEKCNNFLSILDSAGTKRLEVSVGNLEGSENLLKNTRNFSDLNNWFTAGENPFGVGTIVIEDGIKCIKMVREAGTGYVYFGQEIYNLKPNTTYSFSFMHKNTTAGHVYFYDEGIINVQNKIIPASNSFELVTGSFITSNSGLVKIFRIDCLGNSTPDSEMFLYDIKLEDGVVATKYTPAPEDLKPLLYEVYNSGGIEIKKKWNERIMVGTFTLKLTEPEPQKKVIKFENVDEEHSTVSITLTSSKLLNIYWGDGSHTYDVCGTIQTITHSYYDLGTFYIVITGNIDEITSLTTTGKVVWNKL